MITPSRDVFIELKKRSARERKLIEESMRLLSSFPNMRENEKKMVWIEIQKLQNELVRTIREYNSILEKVNAVRPRGPNIAPNEVPSAVQKVAPKSGEYVPNTSGPKTQGYLPNVQGHFPQKVAEKPLKEKGFIISEEVLSLDKEIVKRFRKKKKEKRHEIKQENLKPRASVAIANKLFFRFSRDMARKNKLDVLKKDLMKSNMKFIPETYLSLVIFITLIAFIVSFSVSGFLILFEVSSRPPFVSLSTNILDNIVKFGWIIFIVPFLTGWFAYKYPSLEAKSSASKILQELPLATIHMAAISESMLNPKRIFDILIKTGEYKELRKEFIKLLNEINLHGMNLVSALRTCAKKSPCIELTELFNGIATTINTGGELKEFFEKRSQTLLFEHKISREKSTKVAETFMDIYISIVIAAPMILMLLLVIMNVSGLGISLSPIAISLVIIMGVSAVNFLFLIFLHLKQSTAS